MNFTEFLVWRLRIWIVSKRPCKTCRGSGGHCDMCNDWHNLYKKDWQKAYRKRW